MTKVSVIPVLVEWERFMEENPQGGVREFASWVLTTTDPMRKASIWPEAEPVLKSGVRLSDAYPDSDDFLAWFFMGRLIRYVKFYTKSMMAEHGMANPDEFLFLSLVNEMDRPTKKEVCVAHASELTTGMDILRRLLKQGFIDEFPDERDGRSKRLVTTPKGQEVIRAMQEELLRLQPSVLADLDEPDRKGLLRILQYLNNYHFPYYNP